MASASISDSSTTPEYSTAPHKVSSYVFLLELQL
jgi:hypothetical protein